MWKMGSCLNNNNDNCCYTTTATTTTNTTTTTTTATTITIIIVSLCIEPSQPQRITSGLSTNFTLSPSYSIHKSYFTASHVKKKKKKLKPFYIPWALSTETCIQKGGPILFCGPTQEPELATANTGKKNWERFLKKC